MDRDGAIDKIRKCLALSRSAEPHEAAAALRQAQKLMEAYQVDAADLQQSRVSEATREVPAGALVAWQSALARVICDAFGCECLWVRQRLLTHHLTIKRHRRVVFVGLDSSAEVAAYAFDVLFRQCVRARSGHIAAQPKTCKPATKTARGDRFATGWVQGVSALVSRFAGQTEAATALLEDHMRRKYDFKTVTPVRKDVGRAVRPDDYMSGIAAGRKADLNRGVGSTSRPLLAGG